VSRARHCGQKERHPDQADALEHRARLIAAGTDPEAHLLDTYPCGYCGAWHVGHDRRIPSP
jgi:hypothetical protein